MDNTQIKPQTCSHQKLVLALLGCFILNIVSIGFSTYTAVRWQSKEDSDTELQRRVHRLEKV